jgi:transcription antitermination protein NusB
MISRRYLRTKTFQALYAHFQSDDMSESKSESALFMSLEKMHDLYLFFLLIGAELVHHSKLKMEDAKLKKLPTDEDLNPNTKFINNQIFKLLAENKNIKAFLKDKKISWDADQELITKFLVHLRSHEVFVEYMSTRETSFEADQKFVVNIYKKVIPSFDLLISEISEKSIYWGYDEIDFVLSMVLKTIKRFDGKSDEFTPVLENYSDKKEDTLFVRELFRETIATDKENSKLIADKTKNWDVDRIAIIDILLMKMALTEFLKFKSVPVKVSFNEYIELSKIFSTPKSKVFVNGVLDKLVAELKEKGKLKKMGRGLLES